MKQELSRCFRVLKVKGFSIVDSVSYLENVYKNA